MASRQRVSLTIANGGTTSDELDLHGCRAFSIQAPATLTGTIVLQSSDSYDASGNFATVQSPPGTDITIAASKTTVVTAAPFNRVRLFSNAAEGAQRVFQLWLEMGE
jgi:hypothetical protein